MDLKPNRVDFAPATDGHLMITEKALEWFRGDQDIHEKLRKGLLQNE